MPIRPFRPEDAPALTALSRECARGEGDFVLNPLWETEDELYAEFDRFGIDPETHLLVADADDGDVQGLVGCLRLPDATAAGMLAPIVIRASRGKGIGGELLRGGLVLAGERLGVKLLTAAIGTRNRGGYSLLTSHGFRPVRQHFLMRCESRPSEVPLSLEGLELGPAGPDDAEGILAVYSVCGFEERDLAAMQARLESPRHTHAVARHGGHVVAFAEIETHWPLRVWVAYAGVVAELRDQGVGTSVVTWAVQRAFDGGAHSALLMLSPANRTALRAYEKVGFRRSRLVDVLEKEL